MDEQVGWFLETESTPGEEAVKIVQMTKKKKTQSLMIKLVDKAVAEFETIDSNFQNSTMGKML